MDRCVNFRLCLLLLKHDKSTAYDEDSGSQTPLHLACAADHPEVARALLDHGAPADNRDCNLWTPLGCAARSGNLACVKVMLEEKYSVEVDPGTQFNRKNWLELYLYSFKNHLSVGLRCPTLIKSSKICMSQNQNGISGRF